VATIPTVVISGTSTGIGAETAIAAAAAGWRVVATMRDVGRSERLRAALDATGLADLVQIRQMDIVDTESVSGCIAAVVAEHGSIEALVNNAGSGHVGTLEQESIDDIRGVFEVNFFGTLNVTRDALPHLRATRGRIITVTSVGGVVGQPFNEAYCAAKFAVEGFLEALAPVAATLGVSVTVVEPGAVATEFVANVGVDMDRVAAEAGPYAPALAAYLQRTSGAFAAAQSPTEVAAFIAKVLTADNPPFRVQTSDGARAFVGAKLADLDGSRVIGLTSGWLT
jgi:NAD(P)-dependent dehydrogenase (short-subunit alcohol dehydrogenase family)